MKKTTKNIPLTFKVNSEERDEMQEYAKSKSLPVASMCRMLILEKIREGAENE